MNALGSQIHTVTYIRFKNNYACTISIYKKTIKTKIKSSHQTSKIVSDSVVYFYVNDHLFLPWWWSLKLCLIHFLEHSWIFSLSHQSMIFFSQISTPRCLLAFFLQYSSVLHCAFSGNQLCFTLFLHEFYYVYHFPRTYFHDFCNHHV